MRQSKLLHKLAIIICIIAFIVPTFCLRHYYIYKDPSHQSIDFLLQRLEKRGYSGVALFWNCYIVDESGNSVLYRKNEQGSIDRGRWLRRYIGLEYDSYYQTKWGVYILDCKWYYPVAPTDGSYLIREDKNGQLSLWEYYGPI